MWNNQPRSGHRPLIRKKNVGPFDRVAFCASLFNFHNVKLPILKFLLIETLGIISVGLCVTSRTFRVVLHVSRISGEDFWGQPTRGRHTFLYIMHGRCLHDDVSIKISIPAGNNGKIHGHNVQYMHMHVHYVPPGDGENSLHVLCV